MGCTSSREKLESQMLTLNMRKADIQQEREEHLEKLSKLTGIPVTRKPVRDYLIIPKLGCKETKNLTELLTKKSKNKPKQPMKSIMKNKNGIKTSEKSTSDFTYISKNKNQKVKEESQSSEDDSESESDESERKSKYKNKRNSNYKNKNNKYKKKEYSNSSEEIDEESSDESGKNNSEESYDYED
jgi:hypothetical protein